ncbi:hypothetical protein HYE67_003146 [Fusarium culmorum]|uniref:Uncharacterized protein n=1 Tax=Fusarium culmorum TaxID=5516 RepID=A0A7S8D330_FUSCU|nr:hypothetical protein HYE67_003146 [Fusarium culmorum]
MAPPGDKNSGHDQSRARRDGESAEERRERERPQRNVSEMQSQLQRMENSDRGSSKRGRDAPVRGRGGRDGRSRDGRGNRNSLTFGRASTSGQSGRVSSAGASKPTYAWVTKAERREYSGAGGKSCQTTANSSEPDVPAHESDYLARYQQRLNDGLMDPPDERDLEEDDSDFVASYQKRLDDGLMDPLDENDLEDVDIEGAN